MKFLHLLALQKGAAHFFGEVYLPFLVLRIAGLQDGARGESRFVSMWLAKVAQYNALKIQTSTLKKYLTTINQFKEVLTEDAEITGHKELMAIAFKIGEHLLRAKEFIEMQQDNSHKGFKYIPVQEHKVEAERIDSVQKKCEAIFESHPYLKNVKQRKSWFSTMLHFVAAFVSIRVVAFGLISPSPFGLDMPKGHVEEASHELRELCDNFVKKAEKTLPLSKKTKEVMGCQNVGDEPGQLSEYHQYVPPHISTLLVKCKTYVENVADHRPLEAAKVFASVHTVFPQPHRARM